MPIDTLIHAGWVIPVTATTPTPAGNNPREQVLARHTLAIDNGKIIDLLPTPEVRGRYRATREHHLDKHALLPGLINCHTHAAMNLFRGLADDLPLGAWLKEHIWPAEQRWVSAAFVRDGTRHAVAEMIRGGVTCFNDMYFFPDQAAQVAVETGMRAVIGLILLDFPTAWARDSDEYLRKGRQVEEQYRHHPQVHTAFAPHAPYTVSDTPLRRLQALATETNSVIHMHVHETAEELRDSEAQYGKRPLQRLHELGLLNSRLLAVHMTQLEEEEMSLLAAQGVHVIHCPESNLKLASGFCPVAALCKHGVNVALGTDGAASNNDLDMFGEMRTAALLGKGVSGDCHALPAHRILEMATINGARALRLDHLTGSLGKGKAADVIAIDLGTLEAQPVYDPVSHIVYACGRNQVSDVWVAGKQLLRERQLTGIDAAGVLDATQAWQKKIGASPAADVAP